MKKVAKLFALVLMVLSPSALSAADHIVFIHGWNASADTWNRFIGYLTTKDEEGQVYITREKILPVDYARLTGIVSSTSIETIAENVANQIAQGFPDGTRPYKMDFVVHSMGGLILRYMVANRMIDESRIGRVVTLATPHYGQRHDVPFGGSEQAEEMLFGSEFIWNLANAKVKITADKILCVGGNDDLVVDEWSAALVDEDCIGTRFVRKVHSTVPVYYFGTDEDAIYYCRDGRDDPVYRLVTQFLSKGTISVGSSVSTHNAGAILFQVLDGKDNPVAYKKNGIVNAVRESVVDSSGPMTSYVAEHPGDSANKGIGAVHGVIDGNVGVVPGNYVLDIVESKDKTFSAFTSKPIPVKRGRTTVVPIYAENVKPLDFLFLIDSTGSMSDDIDSVKASARQLIQQKLGEGTRNCRVAIADYRDYPVSPYGDSGDYVFNMRCNFTTNATTAINALNAITVGGGGDLEEAVLSALYSAIIGLEWKADAAKTIMLMGDAGPHDPEPWSGRTSSQVLAIAKENGVSIYPMLTGYSSALATIYETYAMETGGKVVSSASYSSAAEAVQEVIEQSVAANGFETETVNVSETAGSVTVRIYGGNASASASVGYQVVAASAINGKDYSAPSSVQYLSWNAGDRSYKTITIPVMQDASSSADKFFSIILSDPVNMGLGGINVCRVNVLDRYSTGTPAANRVYVQGLARQSAGGSVSGSGSYILGSMITLRATAASGYVFTSWEDGSTSPVRTISSADAQAAAAEGVATYVASFMKLSDLPLPEVMSGGSVSAKVGDAFNWRLDYYSPSVATLTSSGLPPGFSFANGVVSGTATSPGTWTATFTVSNAKGSVNASITFTVEANPVFSGENGTVSGFSPNGATEVDIPNGVTSIGEGAFANCATITSVKVPPTVTFIGKRAFSGCSGLAVVLLPKTLKGRIDPSAFAGCSESLTIQYYDVATVTFDAQGGTLDNPVRKFAVGEPFGELPELHENRWRFLGWRTAADGGDFISGDTVVAGDATYYAAWEADMESIDLGFYDVPGWEQPFFLSLTTNGLAHTTTFEEGDPIYMRYAFMNVAGFAAVNNFVIRFTLNSRTYFDDEWGRLNGGNWGWCGSMDRLPDMLQNLPVGEYSLTCVLDAEDSVAETDEGNNEISLMFEVVPSTKPNLVIDSASVSRDDITLSESAVVHWRVDNNGVTAAGKTKTAFEIWKYDSAGDTWVLKKTDWLDCNPLAVGAGREYTRSVTGKSLGVGYYIIRVWADGKGAIRETDESDNYAQAYMLTVTKDNATRSSSGVDWQFKKLKSAEPDSFFLSASSSLKKKATTFKVGQTIYMRRAFWNAKKKAVNGKVTSQYWLNGKYSETSTDSSYIGAKTILYNGSNTPDFLQNLPAGKYTLTAVIDSNNNWTETNEKNNIRQISFTVVGTPTIYGEETYTCALRESVSWPVSSEGTMSVKGLPPGLKYSGGTIVGKATKVGTYSAKFTAKNAAGTKTKTIKISVVNPGFSVDVNVRANGATGQMFVNAGETVPMFAGVVQNIAVTSSPGKAGIAKSGASSVSVKGLPPGLKYAKGVISGVPSKTGTYTVQIVFKNALGWSKSFAMKFVVRALPAFSCGTFNGWSYYYDDSVEGGTVDVRKMAVTVSTAGKISVTVGSLKFTGTGWTVADDERGSYLANLRAVRTVGTGKKAKKYTDVLTLALDPDGAWTVDQLSGRVATFNGNISLANALGALESGEATPVPTNDDTFVSARRNPFGDNADAQAIAATLAAQGTQDFTDDAGQVWKLKMTANGVATISRTTGSGKNRKTVSATAVLEVHDDGVGRHWGTTRFLVSGKIIRVEWDW